MSRRSLALAALLYAVSSAALTWPVVKGLGRVIPHDDGDPVLNAWILWWGSHHLPLTRAWWDAPIYHPGPGALAFSETLIGLLPIAAPIHRLGGSPQLAYNLLFVLSFFLSALAAHLLARHLTGRDDAALVAGLSFGFAPYRISHLAHLQVLSSWPMPLAFLGLHLFVARRRRSGLLLFASAWLVQSLINGYYLLFLSLLCGLWVLWFATPAEHRRRTLPRIALAWAAAAALLLPLLFEYRRIHEHYNLGRPLAEVHAFSADLLALTDASPLLALWGRLGAWHRPEGQLFPGLAVLILIAAGAVRFFRGTAPAAPAARRRRLAPALLAAGALVFSLLALSVALLGPWTLHIGPLRPRSGPLAKLALHALACLAGYALCGPAWRELWRRRSASAFYALAAVLSFAFALGPSIRYGGQRIGLAGPYAWLLSLPGFDSLRVPARWAMLGVLALAISAALAAARLLPVSGRRRSIAVAALAVALVAEGWTFRLPVLEPPPPCPLLADPEAGPGAVLEVPIGQVSQETGAMFRAMTHGRRVVNGYSGYGPRHYELLHLALSRGDTDMLLELAARGTRLVYVRQKKGAWLNFVAACPGVTRVGTCVDGPVFRLPEREPPPPPPRFGAPLSIARLDASENPDRLRFARDGDLETRWHSEPMDGDETLTITLAEAAPAGGLSLALARFAGDFPRQLVVETSLDGLSFTEAWRGSGAVVAFAQALEDPGKTLLRVPLSGAPARFVRLRQLGRDEEFYWTVAEIQILRLAHD